MNIVRYTLEVGKELTHEEHLAIANRINAVSMKPYTYDPDCPLLTPKQLTEFHPVNYASMEERAQAMKDAGMVDIELSEQDTVLETTVHK